MPTSNEEERTNVANRWPHMPPARKWTIFGVLCVYAALSDYTPLLF